jgi:hypothetical protein
MVRIMPKSISSPLFFFLFQKRNMDLAFCLEFNFLPLTSSLEPDIYPNFFRHYPPAIWQKHPTWYFDDADFFIIIGANLFGLHFHHFEKLTLFREIVDYNQDYRIGLLPHHPIPFDNLKTKVFTNFLQFLYYPNRYIESDRIKLQREDWMEIKHLCDDWYFPHKTGEILRLLYRQRINRFPPLQRLMFTNTLTVFQIMRKQKEMRRNRLPIVEENYVEDDSA